MSHDPEVAARYERDPLVHRKASVRFYMELRRAFKELPEALPRLTIPVLILLAGADLVASAETTTRLFASIGARQKNLIPYEGYYHEVLNEVGRERVLQDLVQWLRVARSP